MAKAKEVKCPIIRELVFNSTEHFDRLLSDLLEIHTRCEDGDGVIIESILSDLVKVSKRVYKALGENVSNEEIIGWAHSRARSEYND